MYFVKRQQREAAHFYTADPVAGSPRARSHSGHRMSGPCSCGCQIYEECWSQTSVQSPAAPKGKNRFKIQTRIYKLVFICIQAFECKSKKIISSQKMSQSINSLRFTASEYWITSLTCCEPALLSSLARPDYLAKQILKQGFPTQF